MKSILKNGSLRALGAFATLVAMFFIANVLVSCNNDVEDVVTIEEISDLNSDILQMRTNVSIPYLLYYTHLKQPVNTCAAASYVVAMDMIVDYTRNQGYHNKTYPVSSAKATSIDTYIKTNYSGGNSPSVGNLQNYFSNIDRSVYPHTNAYYKNFSSTTAAKQYIIDNIAYNVILIPVVVRPGNIQNATQYDGSAYASYPHSICYVVDETINIPERWGHFLILTGIETTNGVEIIRYRDCFLFFKFKLL